MRQLDYGPTCRVFGARVCQKLFMQASEATAMLNNPMIFRRFGQKLAGEQS